MQNDFEQLNGWAYSTWLTTEQAYSGRYAAKVEGPADHALAIQLPLHELGMPRKIRFSAQVWLESRRIRYPSVVTQVWRGGYVSYSQRLRLADVVRRYQQWVPVTTLIVIPDDVLPTDELRIVMTMDQPEGKVFIDDFTLDNAS